MEFTNQLDDPESTPSEYKPSQWDAAIWASVVVYGQQAGK